MGIYTEHWNRHRKDAVRNTVSLLLILALGLPLTVLVAVAVQRATGRYPILLHIGLLAAWLTAFTTSAIRAARVTCPRCGTRYSRGRTLCNCPACDLRMFQDDR